MLHFRKALLMFVALAVLLILPQAAFADHEPNHRFMVKGTVLDEQGDPFANEEVVVTDTVIGLTTTVRTNGSGVYTARLHLHDENVGDELTVIAAGEVARSDAKFDPNDHTKERVQTINVTVKGKDAPAKKKTSPLVYIGWAAAILITAVMAVYLSRRSKSSGRSAKRGGKGTGSDGEQRQPGQKPMEQKKKKKKRK